MTRRKSSLSIPFRGFSPDCAKKLKNSLRPPKIHFKFRTPKSLKSVVPESTSMNLAPEQTSGITSKFFQCDICSLKLKSYASAFNHFYTIHCPDKVDAKTIQCRLCKEKFMWPNELKTHMRLHRRKRGVNDEKKSFLMDFKPSYEILRDLKLPQKDKTEKKKSKYVRCEVCRKKFPTAKAVTVHKYHKHSSLKNNCGDCDLK